MHRPATSLRDRQRAAVRREIHDVAMRLIADRGFDAVTTDEIAAAAGISPSTYYRHVASKEDLLLHPVVVSGAGIVALYDERPADEPAQIALARAISARSAEADDAEVGLWRSAMLTAPDLMARVTLISAADRTMLVSMTAERMGVDDTEDFRPALVVHVLLATAELAYRRWLTMSPGRGRSLSALVDEMLVITCAGDWDARPSAGG